MRLEILVTDKKGIPIGFPTIIPYPSQWNEYETEHYPFNDLSKLIRIKIRKINK